MSAPRFNLPRRVLLGLLFAVGIVVVLIWLFSVAIPNPQVLLPEATSEPDQRTIMIMSNRDGDWDIYEVALADGSAVNLTADDDPQSADGFGSYSSDGGAVSFLSSRNGELEAFNMNADGSDQYQVANDLRTIVSIVGTGRFNWDYRTANGGAEAWVSLRDLNLEIYARTADGDTNLTRSGAIDWFPAWSADGTRLTFGSDREGNQDIYVMDGDGGNLIRLTDDPANDISSVWTTDGRILFVSERETLVTGGEMALYLIDPDAENPQPVPLGDEVLEIAVQMDGDTGVYMSNVDGDWDVYLAEGEGADRVVRNLTDNDTDDMFPAWRPHR
ncbi:MAG: PD40 domain-containing protein [Anaerolinea sp.]|nr:PD40 domain-containing protein [Anaerolinea sp.]